MGMAEGGGGERNVTVGMAEGGGGGGRNVTVGMATSKYFEFCISQHL